MDDTYSDFEALSRSELSGVDYGISVRRALRAFAVVASHGGGIEPGTTEVADAVASDRYSFYSFDGLKPFGNARLHLTSTRFEEPMCLSLVSQSNRVLAIHGAAGEVADAVTFLGGLDEQLGGEVGAALQSQGFIVRVHPDPRLQGLEACNVCNRGDARKGVQLELSRKLRELFFASLSREDRKHPTAEFFKFVDTIRAVLDVTPT
jgi:phage replication-related protein YjqB (UPF0714/DUF867 family)